MQTNNCISHFMVHIVKIQHTEPAPERLLKKIWLYCSRFNRCVQTMIHRLGFPHHEFSDQIFCHLNVCLIHVSLKVRIFSANSFQVQVSISSIINFCNLE